MWKEKKNKEAHLTALSDILSSSKTAEIAILDIMKPFKTTYIYYLEGSVQETPTSPEKTNVFFQFQPKTGTRMLDSLITFAFSFTDQEEAKGFVREIKRFNRRMQRAESKAVKMSIVASCQGSYFVSDGGRFYVAIIFGKLRFIFPNNY